MRERNKIKLNIGYKQKEGKTISSTANSNP